MIEFNFVKPLLHSVTIFSVEFKNLTDKVKIPALGLGTKEHINEILGSLTWKLKDSDHKFLKNKFNFSI